jgi:hypothetical protein
MPPGSFQKTKYEPMKSTDRKARSGMMSLVVIIFCTAIAIAAVYFFYLRPGEPQHGQPSPHAIDQSQ